MKCRFKRLNLNKLSGDSNYESEVNIMTVKSDLQKAIAACESAKGTYSMMANSTDDTTAKQTFDQMSSEVDRHLQFLNSRLDYLQENNSLN